jgi:chorismate mutase
MTHVELTNLRDTIDELDEQLVILLARRFQVTRQVGRLKARQRWQAVDAERESQQQQRYRALATQHELNPLLVLKVFRTIVDEVVSNHLSLVPGAQDAPGNAQKL